jgi:hypothetical protein
MVGKAKVHSNSLMSQTILREEMVQPSRQQGCHSEPTENYNSQTNRCQETLDAQIGTHNVESFIINSAYQKMTMSYTDLQLEESTYEDPWQKVITTKVKSTDICL